MVIEPHARRCRVLVAARGLPSLCERALTRVLD